MQLQMRATRFFPFKTVCGRVRRKMLRLTGVVILDVPTNHFPAFVKPWYTWIYTTRFDLSYQCSSLRYKCHNY